ncbi:MAG: exodeoxyribonuclease VII large subunit [Anaerolineae bacterium]|jgi:hypothetical protein
MELADVCTALDKASPDQLFTTRGRVVEVRRVRRSCYFTLADWDERLSCALLRRYAADVGFWVRVGQVIEVTGHAEQFRCRWQLFVTDVKLIEQLVPLQEVSASLETALLDRLFTTRGKVEEVRRVRRSCYFTLSDGKARLNCALLRRNAMRLDFYIGGAGGRGGRLSGEFPCTVAVVRAGSQAGAGRAWLAPPLPLPLCQAGRGGVRYAARCSFWDVGEVGAISSPYVGNET